MEDDTAPRVADLLHRDTVLKIMQIAATLAAGTGVEKAGTGDGKSAMHTTTANSFHELIPIVKHEMAKLLADRGWLGESSESGEASESE